MPKLKKLKISSMERLKKIWQSTPMSLMHHLEELDVNNCGSIEVLFNIDLGCNIEECSCCLRSIRVDGLDNLREVWRIKGANDTSHVISCFQAIARISIKKCKRFRNVFTPTTINFDMRALANVEIRDCGESQKDDEMVNSRQEQEVCIYGFPFLFNELLVFILKLVTNLIGLLIFTTYVNKSILVYGNYKLLLLLGYICRLTLRFRLISYTHFITFMNFVWKIIMVQKWRWCLR